MQAQQDIPFMDRPISQAEAEASSSTATTHQHQVPDFDPVEYKANLDYSLLSDTEIQQLNESVLSQVPDERPLISHLVPLAELREEYENGNPAFLKQIDYLQKHGYVGIRRTKGDGDCFYRSLAYVYVERIMQASDQTLAVVKATSNLEASLPTLAAAGFQPDIVEEFYDVVISLIRQVILPEPNGSVLNPRVLLEAFQSPEVSTYIVVYMRLLASAQIRTDPITYSPFLTHPETGDEIEPVEFCQRFVEVVGKEADHVQIMALTTALKTKIKVAYLDGRNPDGVVHFVDFSDTPPEPGSEEDVPTLLYRPGHYDILEKRLE